MTAPITPVVDPATPVNPVVEVVEPADKGFPADTPLADMTTEQQSAYHRYHSRKHEGAVRAYQALGTPEQIKAWKDQAEAVEQAKLTPSEQAIQAAREEGRVAALAEANTDAAAQIMKVSLMARGLNDTEADEIVAGINASAFTADNKVDTAKVHAYVNRITYTDPTNGTTRRGPDMGLGRRAPVNQDPREAGKAEAAKRFPAKQS